MKEQRTWDQIISSALERKAGKSDDWARRQDYHNDCTPLDPGSQSANLRFYHSKNTDWLLFLHYNAKFDELLSHTERHAVTLSAV